MTPGSDNANQEFRKSQRLSNNSANDKTQRVEAAGGPILEGDNQQHSDRAEEEEFPEIRVEDEEEDLSVQDSDFQLSATPVAQTAGRRSPMVREHNTKAGVDNFQSNQRNTNQNSPVNRDLDTLEAQIEESEENLASGLENLYNQSADERNTFSQSKRRNLDKRANQQINDNDVSDGEDQNTPNKKGKSSKNEANKPRTKKLIWKEQFEGSNSN